MRKSRILKRDNISKEYLDKREASSLDYSQVHFDYIFENTYQEKNLLEIVNMIKKGLKWLQTFFIFLPIQIFLPEDTLKHLCYSSVIP